MDFLQQSALARANFLALSQNVYPGRGIVAGLDETSEFLVQVYWIMGRSASSRNRVFKMDKETGRLWTGTADGSEPKDPLTIYNAMREQGSHYIVSNGDQTDTVADITGGQNLIDAWLSGRSYEPDRPNFTQRITAVSSLSEDGSYIQMSILRKSLFGDECDRVGYYYGASGLCAGLGFCITTYSGDGNPLPPFRGDPLLMPLAGSMEEVARNYWDALNEDNRVALAVKFIEIGNGRSDIQVINKY